MHVNISEYELYDSYIGEGYSIPYKEELHWMRELTKAEGIFLEPSYTGKAFYGAIDLMEKGHFKSGDHVLFVHTGGIFGLLAQRDKFNLSQQ